MSIVIKRFENRSQAEEALKEIAEDLKKGGYLTVADIGAMFDDDFFKYPTSEGADPTGYGWLYATDFFIEETETPPYALLAKSAIKIVRPNGTKPDKPDKPSKKKVQRMIRIFGNRDYGALEASVNAFLASNEVSRVFRIEYCSNEESGSSGHKFTRYSCMVDYNGYSEVK